MEAKEANRLTRQAVLNEKRYNSALSKIRYAAENGDYSINLSIEELRGNVRTKLMESGYEVKGYINRDDVMKVSWWS